MYPSGHARMQANRQHLQPFSFPHFQKYISILTVSVSDLPEVRQKHANKCLLLTCSGWKSARVEYQQQRSKADKREEHTTRGPTQALRQVLNPQRAGTTCTTCTHVSNKCLLFAPFGIPKSRENTKAHQRKIHFCHVLTCFDAFLPL